MLLTAYTIDERGVPGSRPSRLLLLLHGHDATEHDFTALGPLMDPSGSYLVCGLRGPVQSRPGRWAWFEAGPMGPDPESFDVALTALELTIDHLCVEHLMARGDVVLGGFSQGAAMALGVALSGRGPALAGVLCHSGFLVDVPGLAHDWELSKRTKFLVLHGTRDDVVPIELGRDTAAILEHHGLAVDLAEFDIGHQATVETLAAARDWLQGLGAD